LHFPVTTAALMSAAPHLHCGDRSIATTYDLGLPLLSYECKAAPWPAVD